MAAQKLLQKTSQPNYTDRNSRGHRRRGKYEEDDSSVITLDEWERRKTGIDLPTAHEHSHFSRDEDLARQLQEQFDLEDNHVSIFCRTIFHIEYILIMVIGSPNFVSVYIVTTSIARAFHDLSILICIFLLLYYNGLLIIAKCLVY